MIDAQCNINAPGSIPVHTDSDPPTSKISIQDKTKFQCTHETMFLAR